MAVNQSVFKYLQDTAEGGNFHQESILCIQTSSEVFWAKADR